MKRSAGPGARASQILVACWVIPGTAASCLILARSYQPEASVVATPGWMTGPAGGVLMLAALACAAFWLALPVGLLVIGIGQLRALAPASWRWPLGWASAVLAGTALDPLIVRAMNPFGPAAAMRRAWLTASLGYALTGAALTMIIFAARRSRARSEALPAGR